MRVKIGPYLNWWGPYQIAELLLGNPPKDRIGMEYNPTWRERWADKLGEWLASTWVADACQWVYVRRQRQVYVHIDSYDVWNMDSTLRLIIHPMLVKLQQIKHGSGSVDDDDVPPHLRSTAVPPPAEAWDLDDNFHQRYTWLLDELIWAFGTDHEEVRNKFYDWSKTNKDQSLQDQIENLEVDREALDAYDARVQNAYRLFGKYYQTLWD